MDVVNVVFLTLIMLICVFPFYYLFINTISDNSLSARGLILLYPRGIHFENYVQVFKISGIMQAVLISLVRTLLGTACSVAASAFLGYLLSKQNMLGHKIVYRFIIISMYFNAGIIPWYMNMMNLHLLNNFWVYIIPYIVVPYNIILIKTYMEGISPSLEDAAQIDGATPNQTFWKITLPLIRPILVYTLVTSLIGGLQMFDVPQILTNGKGDPVRSSMTVVMYLNNFIGTSKNYGRAGAVSAIMFVICAVLCVVIMRTTRGDDERKPKPVKAAKAVKGGKAA
mgnify:CR=1 FL=1